MISARLKKLLKALAHISNRLILSLSKDEAAHAVAGHPSTRLPKRGGRHMQLCSFRSGGAEGYGVVQGDDVANLADVDGLPGSLLQLLEGGPSLLDRARRAAETAPRRRLQDLHLLAPIPRGANVLAVGLNYADHARETGRGPQASPACFAKLPRSVAGPYDDIVRPPSVTDLDYEGELGVVIGRLCQDTSPSQAMESIAGYLVLNDVTARDHNAPDRLVLGKAADTFAPMGPWITTSDEVADPQALNIRTKVDGELRQDASTALMIVGVAQIIALLSRTLTLRPGDVIATGSPSGTGVSFAPPRFLQPGQVVSVEISGLGEIRNRVAERASASSL